MGEGRLTPRTVYAQLYEALGWPEMITHDQISWFIEFLASFQENCVKRQFYGVRNGTFQAETRRNQLGWIQDHDCQHLTVLKS